MSVHVGPILVLLVIHMGLVPETSNHGIIFIQRFLQNIGNQFVGEILMLQTRICLMHAYWTVKISDGMNHLNYASKVMLILDSIGSTK